MSFDDFVVPELLPPSEDGVFRTLLTHPDAEPVLRDVIESFLRFPVTRVEVRNVELPISDINEKRERFDVNCSIDDGSQAEVEMQSQAMKGDNQRIDHKIIKSRSIYNLCDLHSGQAGRGIRFDKLLKSYQITFCGYSIFQGNENFINRFSFRDEKGEELSDAVGIVFVELSKLSDIIKKTVEDMTNEEQWSIFFAYGGEQEYTELINGLCDARSEINMARELLSTISRDENERARFRSRRLLQMDINHDRAVTRDEALEEVARKMLSNGESIEKVVLYTGLSQKEVEALRGTQ